MPTAVNEGDGQGRMHREQNALPRSSPRRVVQRPLTHAAAEKVSRGPLLSVLEAELELLPSTEKPVVRVPRLELSRPAREIYQRRDPQRDAEQPQPSPGQTEGAPNVRGRGVEGDARGQRQRNESEADLNDPGPFHRPH